MPDITYGSCGLLGLSSSLLLRLGFRLCLCSLRRCLLLGFGLGLLLLRSGRLSLLCILLSELYAAGLLAWNECQQEPTQGAEPSAMSD